MQVVVSCTPVLIRSIDRLAGIPCEQEIISCSGGEERSLFNRLVITLSSRRRGILQKRQLKHTARNAVTLAPVRSTLN
ncbi:hypothetical protein BH11VER1_BH11VER1_01220 [soil metagenome]